jgi:hypothetical protein
VTFAKIQVVDAKCLLDKKCNPLAITEENERRTDVTK